MLIPLFFSRETAQPFFQPSPPFQLIVLLSRAFFFSGHSVFRKCESSLSPRPSFGGTLFFHMGGLSFWRLFRDVRRFFASPRALTSFFVVEFPPGPFFQAFFPDNVFVRHPLRRTCGGLFHVALFAGHTLLSKALFPCSAEPPLFFPNVGAFCSPLARSVLFVASNAWFFGGFLMEDLLPPPPQAYTLRAFFSLPRLGNLHLVPSAHSRRPPGAIFDRRLYCQDKGCLPLSARFRSSEQEIHLFASPPNAKGDFLSPFLFFQIKPQAKFIFPQCKGLCDPFPLVFVFSP